MRTTQEQRAYARAWVNGADSEETAIPIEARSLRALIDDADALPAAIARAEKAEQERDEAERERAKVSKRSAENFARAEKAEALANRLATDALAALAGAVPTPAEGYVATPHCLRGDIGKLRARAERAGALEAALREAREAIRDAGLDTCHPPCAEHVRCGKRDRARRIDAALAEQPAPTAPVEVRTDTKPVEWRCIGDGLHLAKVGDLELRAVAKLDATWSVGRPRGMTARGDEATLDEAKAAAERAAGVRHA